MIGYLVKRLAWAATLLIIISFITFMLFIVAPGGVPLRPSMNPEITTNLRAQFEYNGKPLPVAYVHFLWQVVRHGQLGNSYQDGQPVSSKLEQAVPVTASLIFGGTVLWILLALSIGILSALRPRTLFDRASMVFVLIGVSAHPIFLGLLLAYVFGLVLHVTPVTGYCSLHTKFGCQGTLQWAYHLVLPWITFAFLFAALYARMVRASVLETMNEDYVRTAVAKGAGRVRTLRRHVLRNALLPIVTMLGMDIGLAFAGAIFVETVFGLPGVGQLLSLALQRRDLPVLMGIVLVVTLAVVIANTIIDVLYCYIDPRVLGASARPRPRVRRLPRPGLRSRAPTPVTRSPTT